MDFSLLRPFDLEAAKRGEAICLRDGGLNRWVGRSESGRANIIERNMPIGYILEYRSDDRLYMAPLCWVENRPVYKGDLLWYPLFGIQIEVTGHNPHVTPGEGLKGVVKLAKDGYGLVGSNTWAPVNVWSWTPPKVKREGWVNIYPDSRAFVRATKESADREATADRVACVRIEWEEGPC